ncbi:acyl-CoA thioesterase [Vermiconidia calcicola]|uniref:Acyl-CoA thioesterase n=1 Tax=Vermiconidia calcicola TaxID=1690605 RepID=A0ACC3MHK7_9PEZI|nr:acyl-CoA thioesterase [Vermiconidia calcicola]
MDAVTLEKCLELKQIGQDAFESVHTPIWTWPFSTVIPGGTLMALGAAAAYETVSFDFSINTLQAHFLAGPKPDQLLRFKVQRLSESGRFATRVVTLEQSETAVVHVTCSFVRTSAMQGRTMTHSVGRSSPQTAEAITLDDLEVGRNKQGPIFKFQRLPLVYSGPGPAPSNPPPESMTYTSLATISSPIKSKDLRYQALGIIALSDYHILDAPPTLHRIPFGQPAIGDRSRKVPPNEFKLFTSLNHNIRFHVHQGFRADDLCYIEVNNPWASKRRAEVQSRIFDREGKLVATCVQETYYVMKEKDDSKL